MGQRRPDGLLEPRMARLAREAGLSSWVFQYPIRHPETNEVLAIADFAYPEVRLAVEVDGFEVHGTPRAMAKDFVRQNGLVPYGCGVLRFTWAQVVRSPGLVADTIARSLRGLSEQPA